MSANPEPTALGALDRLASRASGIVPADAVMPQRPSLFEPAAGAATSEEPQEEPVDHWSRVETESSRDVDIPPPPPQPTRAVLESGRGPASMMPVNRPAAADVDSHSQTRPPSVEPILSFSHVGRREPPVVTPAEPRTIRVESRIVQRETAAKNDTAIPIEPGPRSTMRDSVRPAPATPVITPAPPPARVHAIPAIQPARQRPELHRESRDGDRSVVHVTIGRVEIRASSPPGRRDATPDARATRGESGLDVYLRRRALGSRS